MRLFFSVGDPSGDHHAAELISELRLRCASLECTGFGGPLMREAGAQIDFELTNLSVMGVGAVIPLLGKFTQLYRDATRMLRNRRPDAVVLVDFPGFNWWIAKAARRANIPVIYYMPPQLWAWASWRIRKVRKYVDLVLSPLPFETQWYRKHGVETRYVGHSFLDDAPDGGVIIWGNEPFEGTPGKRVVILPGSRKQEVARNFPVMMAVMQKIAEHHPEARFHVACHKEARRKTCRELLAASGLALPVTLHVGRTQEAIETCDMALMVSGSVSLELLKHTTPAVVLYKCGWMTAAIGGLLSQCQYISLPNLIAEREIMPEFLFVSRDAVHVEGMANILRSWLECPIRLGGVRDELAALRDSMRVAGSTTASAQAADAVVEFVASRRTQLAPTIRVDGPADQRAA